MARKTIYCVQPFIRAGKRLAQGSPRHFKDEESALNAGEVLRRSVAGLLVLAVEGDPVIDYWEEPRVLASYGAVPDD